MSELLTVKEVQELLKVDRITVYRMLKDGRLTGVKIGHQWRFSRQEIDSLLSGAPHPLRADDPKRILRDRPGGRRNDRPGRRTADGLQQLLLLLRPGALKREGPPGVREIMAASLGAERPATTFRHVPRRPPIRPC